MQLHHSALSPFVRKVTILANFLGLSDRIELIPGKGNVMLHDPAFRRLAPSGQIPDAGEALFLSSADWMNRNMIRRVEVAWPIMDAQLRQQVIDECLVAYLHDDRDAWTLEANGAYARPLDPVNGLGAQPALMERYAPQRRLAD